MNQTDEYGAQAVAVTVMDCLAVAVRACIGLIDVSNRGLSPVFASKFTRPSW
jgi:hypothetical protein